MRAWSHRWALIGTIALLGPVAPSVARAAPGQVLADPEARAHFEQAQAHFATEDYAAAIPELKAAYALEPNPMLLYAWAQAERLAGSCSRAVEIYRRFLATDPAEDQRQLAETNLLDCEAELTGGGAEPASDQPPRRWVADPLGGVLFGLGAAGVVSGGVLMGLARRRGKQAPNADIEDDYLALRARAERMNTAGIAVLGVGSALVVGAVIRYVVVARKGRKAGRGFARAARWAPVWTGAGLGVRATLL